MALTSVGQDAAEINTAFLVAENNIKRILLIDQLINIQNSNGGNKF